MDQQNDGKNKDYNEAIAALKSLNVEPSPYMKTRVMARAREARQNKKARGFRWLYAFSGAMAALVVAVMVNQQMGPEIAPMALGTPYMVKADLREMQDVDVAYVKIELEGNLQFASKKFAQVSEVKSLAVSWENLIGKQYLPLVIKGVKPGTSYARVHFYDKDDKLVKTQDFSFNFEKG